MSDKVTNEAVTEKLKIVSRALKLPQQTPRAKTLRETLEKSDRPPPGCQGAARLVVSELRPTRALLLVLLRLTGNHGADPLNRPILNQELSVLATLSGSFLLLGFVGNFVPTAYG